MEITADDLIDYVRKNLEGDFRTTIAQFLKEGNVMDLLARCTSDDLKVAAEWCKKEKIFLVHKVFERVEKIQSLEFLRNSSTFERLDFEKRTWLHVAVMHNRSLEVLRFLVQVKGIRVESEDDYSYTPLHYYCQKERYDPAVLTLLMKSQDHLTRQSKDGLTPLEFACSDPCNLQLIRSMPSVDIKALLRTIDNISAGVMEVEKYSLTSTFSTKRIWLNILQKNDKYMLLSYIKNDPNFLDMYYLEPAQILEIIKKCPENGQGILLYIKGKFFKQSCDPELHKILSGLTGIKVREKRRKRTFYKSGLFLALITGRFELISPLLRSCQFEIQAYAMMICLICQRLVDRKRFPDQVVRDVLAIKDMCETFAIEVMYRAYNKDLSERKAVIGHYVNQASDKLDGKSIVEVAYHAGCRQYLSLPSCQEALTEVWRERSLKCPRIKFWLHSAAHLAFLVLFSYVVVNRLFSRISASEALCYVYGLGYLVEELRQIYLSLEGDSLNSYYVDAANIIDICALAFMLVGFLLRLLLPLPPFDVEDDLSLFKESSGDRLFVQRLVLCLSLVPFYMRVLYFASIFQIMGPKLKMISTMVVKNLMPLIFIFIVFMISFGVTFQALLFPNSFYRLQQTPSGNLSFFRKSLTSTIGDIFRRATFTIFDFHYTLQDVEMSHSNYVTDGNGRYAVYFLLLLFMVVVNVMLMNLLIALFANTVNTIIFESKQSWRISRYGFINEYADRTIAPPPLNLLEIVVELVVHLVTRKARILRVRAGDGRDEEEIPLEKLPKDVEATEELSISYYIYQAFAMSSQRYRILKDLKDLEYEKEVHFRTIEKKLKSDDLSLKRLIDERYRAIEKKIDALSCKVSHTNVSTSASFQ